MHFEEAVTYLLSLGHETLAPKLGLRNSELLLDELSNPQMGYPAVQIAGTNGKGSTAVVLDSICRAAGIRCGLYTSPHLVEITERISIDGQQISTEEFARLATMVRNAVERLVSAGRIEAVPTFFEQVTAIALLAFKEAAVRLAILETGLGGRLDATTVAHASIVGITPVGYDHQEHLGNTLSEIAGEKAAIIRSGVTAVVAPQPAEALRVIRQRSAACNVDAFIDDCAIESHEATSDGRLSATFRTPKATYNHLVPGLRGRHQLINAATAIRLAESLADFGFEIGPEAIRKGVLQAHNPGRLDLRHDWKRTLLLDGAHNPDGARVLRDYLDEFVKQPITLIFGVMHDKDVQEMGQVLFPAARRLIITKPNNPRAADLTTISAIASTMLTADQIRMVDVVNAALDLAAVITPADGLVCVAGSLYLIGEIMAHL